MDTDEIVRLYTEEKRTLRDIANIFCTNHHKIKKILLENNVEITTKGRKRKPFTDEHRRKISEKAKGRKCYWSDHEVTLEMKYKNMVNHIQWDVTLEFLQKFDDIEKLNEINKMLSRKRVSENFNTEKYKSFVEKFYNDSNFQNCYEEYKKTGNRYDRPSLDHIIPLSKGGTWDIENLKVISWFENRAKCDLTEDEYKIFAKKYWG